LNFFCIGANKKDIGITRCFDSNALFLEMGSYIKNTGRDINKENIEKASRLMVQNMLLGKTFINKRSYVRLYGLRRK